MDIIAFVTRAETNRLNHSIIFFYIYILISLIHDIIITLPIKRIAGNDGRDLCHHCHTIIKKYINTVHDI